MMNLHNRVVQVVTGVCLMTVALAGCGTAATSDPAGSTAASAGISTQQTSNNVAGNLSNAMVARLSVMPDVAYAKFVSGAPVDDPAREAQAAAAFVATAVAGGVPEEIAQEVITNQFEAAKAVQTRLISQWRSGESPAPSGTPADLSTQLRPRIDAATTDLVDNLIALYRQGIPADWSMLMMSSVATAQLPPGGQITPADLDLAASTLMRL